MASPERNAKIFSFIGIQHAINNSPANNSNNWNIVNIISIRLLKAQIVGKTMVRLFHYEMLK